MESLPIFGAASNYSVFAYDRSVRYLLDLPPYHSLTRQYLYGRIEAFLYFIDPRVLEAGMVFLVLLLGVLVLLEAYDYIQQYMAPPSMRFGVFGTAQVFIVETSAELRSTVAGMELSMGFHLMRCCYSASGGKKKKKTGGVCVAAALPPDDADISYAALQRSSRTAAGPLGAVVFVTTRAAAVEGYPPGAARAAVAVATQYVCYLVDDIQAVKKSVPGVVGRGAEKNNHDMALALLGPNALVGYLDVRKIKALSVE